MEMRRYDNDTSKMEKCFNNFREQRHDRVTSCFLTVFDPTTRRSVCDSRNHLFAFSCPENSAFSVQIQVRSALLPTLTPRVKSHSIENAEENRRKNEEKQCRSKVCKLSKALHFRNGITIECKKITGTELQ